MITTRTEPTCRRRSNGRASSRRSSMSCALPSPASACWPISWPKRRRAISATRRGATPRTSGKWPRTSRPWSATWPSWRGCWRQGRIVRPQEVVLEQLVDQVEEAVRPRAWEAGGRAHRFPRLPPSPGSSTPIRTACARPSSCCWAPPSAMRGPRSSSGSTSTAADLRIVISSDGPPLCGGGAAGSSSSPFRTASAPGGRAAAGAWRCRWRASWCAPWAGSLQAENRDGKPAFVLSLPPPAPSRRSS